MCAMTVSSCLSVSDNSVNHTVYSLYDFTQRLVKKSLDSPVAILNGLKDEELFSPDFETLDREHNGMKIIITHPQDSVWRISSAPEEAVRFTTDVRMLPENASFLNLTKHSWAVSTEGGYTEDHYSAEFHSEEEIIYSWKFQQNYGDSESYIISPSRKGSFRMDTRTGSTSLDYGILSMDGDLDTFDSSLGPLTNGRDVFYFE